MSHGGFPPLKTPIELWPLIVENKYKRRGKIKYCIKMQATCSTDYTDVFDALTGHLLAAIRGDYLLLNQLPDLNNIHSNYCGKGIFAKGGIESKVA